MRKSYAVAHGVQWSNVDERNLVHGELHGLEKTVLERTNVNQSRNPTSMSTNGRAACVHVAD
jgi:hypothetical protein